MYDVYGGTGYFHVLIPLCFKNNLYVVKFCVFISLLLILVEYKTCLLQSNSFFCRISMILILTICTYLGTPCVSSCAILGN